METGRLKKVFPGGNTSRGFYSLYDYIIGPEAARIFIIKGGPGTGKSTFMKKIGEDLLARGFDVEFHCCSGDSRSIDGLMAPALNVALMDGTAPHIIDPKNPGAVDQIINLGDHWNPGRLQEKRDLIVDSNREVGRLFRRAHGYLASAKIFLEQVESYYQDTGALDIGALDSLCLELTHEIFEGRPRQTGKPWARRLFITAITPDGAVSHLDTVVRDIGRKYVISGDDGTGKSTLVRRLMDSAMMRGFNVEAFHCALTPENVDHLIIPALDTAVINSVEPHFYMPGEGDRVIDTMQFVNPSLNSQFLAEKATAREMYRRSMDLAVEFLAMARAEHDRLESFYAPFMNFDEIEARREKTLAAILELEKNKG